MIAAEYSRFLQTLISTDVQDEVRKIANLVQQHLDTLVPLTTSQGQRIKQIVNLAQTNWNSLNSEIQLEQERAQRQVCPVKQLKMLLVGPFRGFAKQEELDLSGRTVLLYGPNGTGKSSFCEALEYALLGNVNEAESKRFRNQNDYFTNAYTKSFTQPTLLGQDNQGKEILVTASETLYRFCFIEKNRIDSFSRIAAQAPSKQSELISILFGLEDFLDFTHNFTASMDNYIDLKGVKGEELKQKKQGLAGYQQSLISIPELLEELSRDENELAIEYSKNHTYTQMLLEINGTGEAEGLIAQLEAEIEKPIGLKCNLTLSRLLELKQSVETLVLVYQSKKSELDNTSRELSYKKLYEAIIELHDEDSMKCPACQTPLRQVCVNPFKHADAELKKLEYIAELQDFISETERRINDLLSKLRDVIITCCSNYSENNILNVLQSIDEKNVTIDWWGSLFQPFDDKSFPWQYIEAQVKKLEDADNDISRSLEKRAKNIDELKRLRGFAEKIIILQARKDAIIESKRKAQNEINEFDTRNACLIEATDNEMEVVAQNRVIAEAYAIFVKKINDYMDGLPALLVADIGEIIVRLYNEFNRQDAQYEQFANVRLPLQQNQKLEISYKDKPDLYFDALHVLSEGHIRCIGLAVLAAKNILEDCPFLIFDDPVNAIDDDHREAIRRTLFEDSFFEEKQIILACHGEEFFKDIQNQLPVNKAQTIKTISFLPIRMDHHICVDQHCAPRNYIIAAFAHLDKNEIRDALDKSRKALESLTKDKVWRYVNKYGDGYLSIQMKSPSSPIELRNLTEQLCSKIKKADFKDQNKDSILNPIESLLGINRDSREWRYMNKGTHEEANHAEFNRQTVINIITFLGELDKEISSKV